MKDFNLPRHAIGRQRETDSIFAKRRKQNLREFVYKNDKSHRFAGSKHSRLACEKWLDRKADCEISQLRVRGIIGGGVNFFTRDDFAIPQGGDHPVYIFCQRRPRDIFARATLRSASAETVPQNIFAEVTFVILLRIWREIFSPTHVISTRP